MLLDEYHRWSGDTELVRALEPNARAALAWIEDSGDADGDGYVEYACRNLTTGLVNQCWKDSWDAIQYADGTLAKGPIATCEIQGYVYDARRRCARLARELWGDPATAERVLDEQLYSGWDVRTLGTREAGYNPLGYHTGTVWPHESSLIAAGLARYGHRKAASTIASTILQAAPYFEYRLPEVFAGYPASVTSVPVAFPTASRPQAWAAGTPLLLLSTLLDLHPGCTEADVEVPCGIGHLALRPQRD